MPYNRLAEADYESVGCAYSLVGLEPPSDARAACKERLEVLGLTARVGG
jgi:hypothetical protein